MRLVPDAIGSHPSQNDALREICEKDLAEPAHIWEDLEANGINVTPGVVYQAIGTLHKLPDNTPSEGNAEKAAPDRAVGLTVEDLELAATLVEKAGGIERLVRCLGLLHKAPTSQD